MKELLTQPLYAGHLERKEWNISMRNAKHDGLISFETFQQIQHRLKGKAKTPSRKDISRDFPLRGFILCEECERPLTSCWAQGKYQKFPYYMCYNKECSMKGKTIARDSGMEHILLRHIHLIASDSFKALLPDQSSLHWKDVVNAAQDTSQMLGVNQSAWVEECGEIGRAAAAICIIIADRRIADGDNPIRNVGGFLRGCVNKARAGELHLHKSVFGLLRKDNDSLN